jgi:hypothetical protein
MMPKANAFIENEGAKSSDRQSIGAMGQLVVKIYGLPQPKTDKQTNPPITWEGGGESHHRSSPHVSQVAQHGPEVHQHHSTGSEFRGDG